MKTKFRESSTFVLVVSLMVVEHILIFKGVFVSPDLVDYGIANTALMSIWLGREWRASHYADKE